MNIFKDAQNVSIILTMVAFTLIIFARVTSLAMLFTAHERELC